MITTHRIPQHDHLQHDQLLAQLEASYEFHTEQLARLAALPRTDPERAFARAAMEAASREAIGTVAAALRDMAEGRYGLCANCQQPIPAERLQARPETRYCVPCQGEHARRVEHARRAEHPR